MIKLKSFATAALASALLAASPTAILAQSSASPSFQPMPAMSDSEYLAMAAQGSTLLETSSRLALEKGQSRQVRNFARAEVREQVSLANRLNSNVATGTVNVGPSEGTGRALGVTGTGNPGTAGGPIGGSTGSALAGAGVGALVGGPIGALVGAGVGYTGGAALGRMSTPQEKQSVLAQLEQLPPGPEFDMAYVQTQLIGHQEAYALHASYAQNGPDPEMRRIAANAVPMIRRHLAALERMSDRMAQPAR